MILLREFFVSIESAELVTISLHGPFDSGLPRSSRVSIGLISTLAYLSNYTWFFCLP